MELLELDFKNLMNICELNQGDILYFSNRDGFRNSRPENIGFHSQLPDFIVVDDVRLTDNGWQVDIVGFKNNNGAIVWRPGSIDESVYFNNIRVNIDEIGTDLSEVRESPYVFSNWFKVGGAYRSDNTTVVYVDSLMSGMVNFNPSLSGNNGTMMDIFRDYNRSGTMLPSEKAYVINRCLKGLYQDMLTYNEGNVKDALHDLNKILKEVSMRMDTCK